LTERRGNNLRERRGGSVDESDGGRVFFVGPTWTDDSV